MKCILYGIGSGMLRAKKYLRKEHEIVGYSDSFAEYTEFQNKKFYRPQELANAECDFIIICIGNKDIREEVINNLKRYKVDAKKIFDFYAVYTKKYIANLNIPITKFDRVMYNNHQDYEGIILGISHATLGINPKYLEKRFCNLAVASQDLYYNLQTVEIVNKKYKERIKNLEYVIIDMYNYTYFNYDVSLTKGAIEYYKWSGFRSDNSHNYNKNKFFNKSIEKELENYNKIQNYIPSDENYIFNNLFTDIDIFSEYKKDGLLNRTFADFPCKEDRKKCLTDEEIYEYRKNYKKSSLQKKKFKETIKENIHIFDKMMKLLTNINKNMKIYLVMVPVYQEDINNINKTEFNKIINKFKEKYNFEFLDFYKYKEISSNKKYFYDMDHLNYDGATEFTKILNLYIK